MGCYICQSLHTSSQRSDIYRKFTSEQLKPIKDLMNADTSFVGELQGMTNAKRGQGPHSHKLLCSSMYCLFCVVLCTVCV